MNHGHISRGKVSRGRATADLCRLAVSKHQHASQSSPPTLRSPDQFSGDESGSTAEPGLRSGGRATGFRQPACGERKKRKRPTRQKRGANARRRHGSRCRFGHGRTGAQFCRSSFDSRVRTAGLSSYWCCEQTGNVSPVNQTWPIRASQIE